MASQWAKIDALLPVNPKAFQAGFAGTAIFMHLILINKAHRCGGLIPPGLAAPKYLARYLQIEAAVAAGEIQTPRTDERANVRDVQKAIEGRTIAECASDFVRSALNSARDAGLVGLETGGIRILGWDDSWDKAPTTSAERGRKYRERLRKDESGVGSERERTETNGKTFANETERQRDANARVEENRIEENTPNPSGGPARAVEPIPGPPPSQKRKRATELDRVLAEHGAEAGELWDLQEMLRASAIPRSRPLEPTSERLGRICQRLAGGASREDCEAVLRSYAAEAKRDPGAARHLNGVTNWRPENFDRTLGACGSDTPAASVGRATPMARDATAEAGPQDLKA